MEQSTLTYLATLTDEELNRVVTVEDWPPQHQRFKLDGLLWHVIIHEMRHTAQIAVLPRSQGVKPPALDCCFTCQPPRANKVVNGCLEGGAKLLLTWQVGCSRPAHKSLPAPLARPPDSSLGETVSRKAVRQTPHS